MFRGHLNERGNKFVATAIYEELKNHLALSMVV